MKRRLFSWAASRCWPLVAAACLALCTTPVQAAPAAAPVAHADQTLPLAITPEGVRELIANKSPFILLDSQKLPGTPLPDSVRKIYFTTALSATTAHVQVLKDRSSPARDPAAASQYLTGTPLDWQRLQLPLQLPPAAPVRRVSPHELADALKDGADLQLVDIRPASAENKLVFPQAQQVLPHQLEAASAQWSKARWVVLIDGGHDIAGPLADQLAQRGFKLAAVLDGGYPAWVAATDR